MQFASSFANCAVLDDGLHRQCQPEMHDVTLSLARAGPMGHMRLRCVQDVRNPHFGGWWLVGCARSDGDTQPLPELGC